MFKSNIAIASNVYVRASEDLEKDPAYVAAINDASALRVLSRELEGTLSKVKLSPWQIQVLQETSSCIINAKADRKDFTHGLVKTENGFAWACRCENQECDLYDKCMSEPYSVRIQREAQNPESEASGPELSYRYEFLGDISGIFTPPEDENLSSIRIEDQPYEPYEDANDDLEEMPPSNSYAELKEAEAIIKANIKSHILVNAGAGTGKTHTIIKRLEHIAKTRLVRDFSNVLVLCFTNAAKNEILKRLEAGISSGELPIEARLFCVNTIDMFATAYLIDIEAELVDGYKERINQFNEMFDPEMLANFEYAIVDEIQDLVNERADMTLRILDGLSCGWLLCGDKCQAIYDFDSEGSRNGSKTSSLEFYQALEENLPKDAQKFELVGNRRQTKELAGESEKLRNALLNGNPSEANAIFKGVANSYRQIPYKKLLTLVNVNRSTAILCRRNIDAEWLSTRLYEEGIKHTLIRSAATPPPLNRWIADVFWDYREKWCSREEFISRYRARVLDDENKAEYCFNALSKSEASVNYLNLDSVRKSLASLSEADPILLSIPDEKIVVSTIHKSKGREFDSVYLACSFYPKPGSTSEARVWYVGATRPKSDLHVLKPLKNDPTKPQTHMHRLGCFQTRKGRYGGREKDKFVSELMVGVPGDINSFSFASGSLAEAIEIQSYIAANVKAYDPLEIWLRSGKYEILHKGQKIGELSSRVKNDFMEAVKQGDISKKPPGKISDIFVSCVITVMPRQFPSGMERMFKESKFWLGVEITGLGKVDWRYGGMSNEQV
ncbi:MAG: AAA family ATPase [Clostridiales bacterium]|nr:AAA family ATPase [Clostridiales bacterium]